MASAREAVGAAADALTAAGCDTPRLDAELLIADAIGVDRAALVTDPSRTLDAAAARLAMERVRRRTRREPVAYILGRRAFRQLDLAVDRRVLIPRPESELLVEVATELAPPGASVHDVGTGSGAVALALAHERPDLTVTASDASASALEVARANANRLGLDVGFAHAPGLSLATEATLDLVVANLPYVREDEWSGLEPEITRWEPRSALLGGADGLEAIRSLAHGVQPGTLVALEHAPGQAAAVRELLRDAGTRTDLSGRPRVTVGHAR